KLLRNKDLTIENIPLTLISAVEQSNYKYDRNGKIVSLSLFSSKKTSINERHKKYLPLTEKYSKEYGVASALLLAIIRVESAFNPLAKSHIPAYGLMQIRPIFYNEVNGSSISNHVEELYKPDTNIRVGAAYLSKLKYLYLEDIEDLNKKQLTMIASYHGGFNSIMKSMNENSLKSTTKKINEISFEEYYHTLVENLPYDETINYIEKVWDRFEYYQEQLKVSTSLDIER
ncbi:transglycosylase SLT domain-containing protein, partial [Vibrio splendidus]|uniref:transglycosylase SLT domain-containing protein n=1 Tax=Vibrio splendidus TaxID=29497 RepID=UPI00159ED8EF